MSLTKTNQIKILSALLTENRVHKRLKEVFSQIKEYIELSEFGLAKLEKCLLWTEKFLTDVCAFNYKYHNSYINFMGFKNWYNESYLLADLNHQIAYQEKQVKDITTVLDKYYYLQNPAQDSDSFEKKLNSDLAFMYSKLQAQLKQFQDDLQATLSFKQKYKDQLA